MAEDFYKGKRCFVTGIQGFIGSNIGKALKQQGAIVYGLIKDKRSNSALHAFDLNGNIEEVRGDLKDFDLVQRVIAEYQIQYIFHLGAHSTVQICAQMPLETVRTNVIGTANILESARGQTNIEGILVASSDKAYGESPNLPYEEEMPLNANDIYDATKAMADILSRAYAHNYRMPIVVTRSANAYGPGDLNPTRLFPRSIQNLLRGQSPVLYSGVEDFKREFVFVEDLAEAYLELGKYIDQTRGQAYNIGTGKTHRIGDVIKMIRNEIDSGIPLIVEDKDDSFKEISEQWLDNTKIYQDIGWTAKVELKDGLKKTIEWYGKQLMEN